MYRLTFFCDDNDDSDVLFIYSGAVVTIVMMSVRCFISESNDGDCNALIDFNTS